jgi:hypothetical protein
MIISYSLLSIIKQFLISELWLPNSVQKNRFQSSHKNQILNPTELFELLKKKPEKNTFWFFVSTAVDQYNNSHHLMICSEAVRWARLLCAIRIPDHLLYSSLLIVEDETTCYTLLFSERKTTYAPLLFWIWKMTCTLFFMLECKMACSLFFMRMEEDLLTLFSAQSTGRLATSSLLR